jgi:hypothetical protein
MARITGIALTVAACLGLAACGSASKQPTATTPAQPPETARLLGVARDYQAAYVDGDYAKVCALLTPAARASYLDAATANGDASCAAVLESVLGAVDGGGTTTVRTALVSRTGTTARVRTTVEGQRQTIALVRTGGAWRVDAGL